MATPKACQVAKTQEGARSNYPESLLYPNRYEMVVKDGSPYFFYAEEGDSDEKGVRFIEKRYGEFQCVSCAHVQTFNLKSPSSEIKEKDLRCEACGRLKLTPVVDLHPWKGMDFPLIGAPLFVDNGTLWNEIYKYLKDTIEYPSEEHYALITTWIMSTWRQRELRSVAYMAYLGPMSSGKTYALEVLMQLCYHPIFTISESPPALVLDIEMFGPTLLIDQAEKTMSLKFEQGELLYRIVAAGYRQGAKYRRRVEGKLENVSFDTFCSKALGSTRLWDSAINSRCYAIKMRETKDVYEIDEERAFELRRKLMGWSYGGKELEPLPKVETVLRSRRRDLAMGLLQVLGACGLDEQVSVIEDVTEQEWAALMEVATIEDFGAVVVSSVHDIILEHLETWDRAMTVERLLSDAEVNTEILNHDIRVNISDIVNRIGEGASKTRISRELTVLGITKRRKSGAQRYFIVSEYNDVLLRLFQRYRLVGELSINGADDLSSSSLDTPVSPEQDFAYLENFEVNRSGGADKQIAPQVSKQKEERRVK